jgi:hypothetical protein
LFAASSIGVVTESDGRGAIMHADFSSIHNAFERAVYEAVLARHPHYPQITEELLPDVACVALNRVPQRYVRHSVDLAFYQTDTERIENERSVREAVEHAFRFVQARVAMRAR